MNQIERDRRRLQADAFLQMTRIHRVMGRRMEQLFAEADCQTATPAQANVLMVLFQFGGPMTARKLAEEMAVSDVTMGRFVKALEGNGWVTRKPDPNDSRARLIEPTKRAREFLPKFASISNQALDEAFGDMSKERLEAIVSVISQVRQNLER